MKENKILKTQKPEMATRPGTNIIRFLSLVMLILVLCRCNSVVAYSGFARTKFNKDIRKVGVIPFINESGRQGAGEIVTSIFTTVIFKSGVFQVEEGGNIEHFLNRLKLKSLNLISKDQLKKMRERLGLDAVFMGTVEEFSGGDQGQRLSTPVVSIRAKLIDLRSGQVVWMTRHRRKGDDYIKMFDIGRVRSVSTLTKQVLTEAVKGML